MHPAAAIGNISHLVEFIIAKSHPDSLLPKQSPMPPAHRQRSTPKCPHPKAKPPETVPVPRPIPQISPSPATPESFPPSLMPSPSLSHPASLSAQAASPHP